MLSAPPLPRPRGPVSSAVIDALQRPPGAAIRGDLGAGDPMDDDDVHLALYVSYELHYRGWRGVDPEWEWDPGLLALRARLERAFLAALRAALPPSEPIHPGAVVPAIRALLDGASGPSVSAYAERRATVAQLRELAIHRSAYQLKEADPHTWAIPRLPAGAAKSAMLGLQMDEYGNGEPGRSHAELFAATMRDLDLDPTYGSYLDQIPGVVLATVNLLSLFGLHRRWAAACVGHLSVFEMTSVVPMGRYARAMRRVGRPDGAEFYDVHVTADAVHQVVAAAELIPGLLAADPSLGADVLFGASALMLLEGRVAEHLLRCWRSGRSSLLESSAAVDLAS